MNYFPSIHKYWRHLKEWWYMVFKQRYFIVKQIGDEAGNVQSEWYLHPLINSWHNTGWKWEMKPYYHFSYLFAMGILKSFQRKESISTICYYLVTVQDYFFAEDIKNAMNFNNSID